MALNSHLNLFSNRYLSQRIEDMEVVLHMTWDKHWNSVGKDKSNNIFKVVAPYSANIMKDPVFMHQKHSFILFW